MLSESSFSIFMIVNIFAIKHPCKHASKQMCKQIDEYAYKCGGCIAGGEILLYLPLFVHLPACLPE